MRMGFRKKSSVEKIKNKCIPVPRIYQKITTTDKLILNVSLYRNCFIVQNSMDTFIYYTGQLNPRLSMEYISNFHDNCSTTEGFKDIKSKFITNKTAYRMKYNLFERGEKKGRSFKEYR